MPKMLLGRAVRFSVTKSSIKFHLKLGKFLHFYGICCLNPVINTMGVISRCADGMHCLFADYDEVHYSVLRDDILRVQRDYEAGTAVVLSSGELSMNIQGEIYGNFHVIFCSKHTFATVNEIIQNMHTDLNFRDISRNFSYRTHVLRIYPKYSEDGALIQDRPKLYDIIHAETNHEINRAMYDFLRKYYGVPEWTGIYAPKLDMLTDLGIIKYNTTMGWKPAIKQKVKSLFGKGKVGEV
jgi:hypothetical protein